MRTSSRLYPSHLRFRLGLIVCLAASILGYAPAIVRGGVALADPPPPPEAEWEETGTGGEPEPPLEQGLESLIEGAQMSPSPLPLSTGSSTITHTIHLKARQVQPSPGNALDLQSLRRLARPGQDRIHVLVQLDFIPRQTAKDELTARGLRLLAYVPDYAWIASIPATNATIAVESPGVRWIGELTVDDKLDPAITADQWGEHNLAPDGTAAVYVALHQDEGLDTGRTLVEAHGGQATGEAIGINLLVVEMPKANIRALAAEDAVQWIEPVAPPLTGTNDGIRPQIGVDVVQAAPYNLDGTGIDVLVYDSGQAGNHVDFGARLIHGDADSVEEHSTHVAGTVGGNGSNSVTHGGSALQWRGMAPNADLISYGTAYPGTGVIFYENVPDIEHDWAQGQNTYGADIGTASLGSNIYWNYYPTYCNLMGNYGASSVLIDQIVRGGNSVVGIGDRYIATWAAGNERGWGTSCAGAGGGYGLVAPPAGAKNPIHVGGSNTNNNTQYAHTSWGPTDDGRIKPIVTAGACQTSGDGGIKSTDNSPVDAYTVMCGTSMATPAVAGGIALMLQHYRDVYNTSGSFWPSTAKAILMQTAVDFGNPGPDYQWGYGQVDIHAAVDLISRKAFRQESIAQGEVDVYYLVVPDDANPTTVSLAWDDYEATLNANPTLINNLDLELVAPDGTLWRPWVLNPASPANNATRGTDNRNNQEQVQVDTPEIGTWLVRVKGTSVPQGPQGYSLACEGCQPLNLGVCQGEVSGVAMAAPSLPEAEGPTVGAGEEELLPRVSQEEEALSAGELWQRALEAQAKAGAVALAEAARAALEAEIAAFEVARQAGPRATVALLDTLSSAALDLVEEEIVEAQEQLHESAPLPPETEPVSEAEEQAVLQAQEAVEAANRARALTSFDDPAEGQSQIPSPNLQIPSPTGPAADLTVGNGCTYATIGAAIAAANPGDTLLIEGGVTFPERFTIPINLTLRGGYDGCDSGSTARTTINGGAGGRVIVINPGLDVTLENLNVTNGSTALDGGGIWFAPSGGTGTLNLSNVHIYGNTAQWGGGLWVGANAEVVGTNVEIYNNTATATGGGVRLWGGRATFSDGNIRNNSAPMGGGVSGVLQNTYAPSLNLPSSADVYDNQAMTGGGFGGGVYMRQGTVFLADCSDIHSNDAVHGGGAYLVTTTLTIEGSCSEIQYNTATGNGGGVYAQGSSVNLDDEAELYYNNAGTDGSGSGGGAYLDDSDLYSDRASIRYNTADDYGGGVYATNGSRVDMDLDFYTCLGPRCSRLYGNTASSLYGGGIYANGSTVDLRNIFVEYNTALLGGGVYAYDSGVYAYNNLFARNNATSTAGDGIRLFSGATLYGAGNTLAYNNAGGASTGRAIDLSTSSLSLGCSIIWGHTSSINVAGEDVTYSDVQGGYAGTGNLDVNPLFVSSGSYDYHLQASSPVIDRCLSGASPDFDNERRPVVRVTAATPYDMGADEAAGVDRVGLNGMGCTYATIQQAVNAASDGDTLQAAAGIYFENVDIGNKDITVEGGYDSTCTTSGAGTTRIEGSAGSGSTVDVSGGGVNLHDLQIAWGNGTGGGIDAQSGARVTLDNTDVFDNHGTYGGGVNVSTSSAVTITSDSQVRDNTATSGGGGARVYGRFYGRLSRPPTGGISSNCAPDGGGVSVPGGDLYLNASSVYLNRAADTDGQGGGIHLTSGGEARLTNSSYVYYLNEAYDGAGIYADSSTVYMEGANTTIRDNVASHYGGGVYLTNDSALYSSGARIGQGGNPGIANEATYGAGLYAENSTVDFDGGNIINNIAAYAGGGIYATGSILNLTGTRVGGTGASEANQLTGIIAVGAGLYLANGTQATLSNTIVASNTLPAGNWAAAGGGAAAMSGSTLTLINSRVERHLALLGSGAGAGIYVSDGTVTLDNSQVLSNTAGTSGGGLRLYNGSTLDVLNGSVIRNNEATNADGGGISVSATSGTPDVNISDSTLQGNTAGTNGGAVAISAGTLDFSGWWDVQNNHADGNGGAVAVLGTGDGEFRATGGPSHLSNNTADGNGGALYIGNADYVTLRAEGDSLVNLNSNSTSGNGGAVHAGSGATVVLQGRVDVTTNNATGDGGAFYLDGGSVVGLLPFGDYAPRVLVNSAANGGAVYATGSSGAVCLDTEFGSSTNGNQATAGSGGAVYLDNSELIALNCTFRNGQATLHGGAVYASNASTMTIQASYPLCDPLSSQCSSFYGNTANSDGDTTGYGGAIYANDSALQVDHTYLHRNSAILGGAIYQVGTGATARVNNSLIYSNTASSPAGAGIRVFAGDFSLVHSTLADNTGSAGFSPAAGTSNVVTNSIAWGNEFGGFAVGGTYVITGCNIDQDGYAGINVDPQFVAPGLGEDYHLLGSSPAIDQCATGLPRDLDNALRPVGSGYDMGAYEYPYAIQFAPDNAGSGLPLSDVLYTHTLTNGGGLADTYTLTAQSDQGWPVAVSPWPTVTLNGGQSTPVNVTVSIPGGELSGTVDTTVVTATSTGDPTLAESVTDLTTVGFAPGAAFAPDYVTTGAVETTSYDYIHTLTNTGNAQDTFTLAWASTRGWGNLLTSSPVILNPGQAQVVVVRVIVPVGGSGKSDTTVVTATSAGGAGPIVVRDITSAFTPDVAFTPDHAQTVSPDTVLTYTHYLTNTGGSTDTFHLGLDSTMGWATLLDPGPFTLLPDQAETVRVRVVVPPGSAGMTDTTTVTATSAGGAGPVAVQDTTAVYEASITFVPNHTQTVPAGSALTYTHRLTNTGGGPDIFDVGVASTSLGWATLLDPGPFALNAGEGSDVRLRVDAPFGSGGLTDVTVITATSRAGSLSGISVAVTDTTSAIRTYGAALAPDYAWAVAPGETVTYTHWLTNTGNGTDKFNLAFSSSQHWAALVNAGPFKLEASEGISVHVRVEVPLGSGGLEEITLLQATSELSPTFSASVTDTTTSIYTPSIVLTPDYDQVTAPGSTLTHTHWLTNTGNGSDQFNLGFTSSQGWATLLDPGPFALSAGEGITLQVQVDVPVGAGGLMDITVVTATSQSGGLSATATDTTTVPFIPGVEIGPDQAQSVVPDGTYIYVHILENTGNGSDTFDVAMSSSLGWATLLDPGPFALGAGETAPVQVSVHVPSGLISGTLTDVTVITATSQAAPALSDTATDTTTVGFAPGVAFAPDHLIVGASPLQVIDYTHGLTNTGNYTDTFELVFASSAGWGSLLDLGPFDLGPGQATTVQVQVTVPVDGSGKSDVSVITATSQGGAGPVRVHDATAAFVPGVAFVPDYSARIDPGDSITYVHTLTNTGGATDTFTLDLVSSRGWAALANGGPFTLLPDEAITVSVVVNAPVGYGGLTDVSTVTARSLGGFGPAADVIDTTTITYTPGVALEPDQAQTVPVGSAVIYTHYLTNTGDGPDTFSLALYSSQGWSALLDAGPFALSAGDSTQVRVQVDVPTDTVAFAVDATTITATAALGSVSDAATDVTTVACEPLFGADFAFSPSAPQAGQAVTFTGSVVAGSPPIAYAWDFGDSSGQHAGNPIAHTFATSGTFTVLMTATNNCPSQMTATHDIVVTVAPDITVDPLSLSAILNPGDTATRTLTVGNAGTSNLDWSLTESPTRTWLSEAPVGGTIAPAGSTLVNVIFDALGQITGTYTTTLYVASNDPDEPLVRVPITLTVATGVPPDYFIHLPVVMRSYSP